MSYRLEAGESLPEGIKRIAKEQIDQATEQLTEAPEGRNEAVHDARKRFKKVRAVLRLVRDEIGRDVYKPENVCFRDAGRELSDVRDSFVMVETLDAITDRFGDQLADDAFAQAREALVAEHEAVMRRILDAENAMTEVTATIQAARQRVDEWPIEQDDFSAVYDGLKRVYKRGRKGFARAYDDPTPENFHDWRKRVKYLWYHVRILKPLWPDLLDELADQIHDLSDYLGDDHDLAELRATVLDQPEIFSDKESLTALVALIDQWRAELEAEARPLGERIYVEKPKDFVDRIAAYWPAWQTQQQVESDLVP